MGVSEQLQAVLASGTAPTTYDTRELSIISRGSSVVSKSVFYSSHSYPHDSGIEESTSGVSLPPDGCYGTESSHSLLSSTPLHCLPGSNYFQLDNTCNSKVSYSGLLKRHYRQGIPAQHSSSATPTKSLTAAYNRPSCAFGNRWATYIIVPCYMYVTLLWCVVRTVQIIRTLCTRLSVHFPYW